MTVTLDMNASLSGLTVDAGDTLIIGDGQRLSFSKDGTVNPTVVNNGTVRLNSTGTETFLRAGYGANLTLSGSGQLILGGELTNIVDRSYGGLLANDTGHTIAGGGIIAMPLVNKEQILANNQILMITEAVSNQGVMKASGSGNVLDLRADVTGGQINPNDGAVKMSWVTLTDTSLVAGQMDVEVNSRLRGASSIGVTVASGANLSVLDGQILELEGKIVNNGTITLQSIGGNTYLRTLNTETHLQGTGQIILGDNLNNILDSYGLLLTNDSGHTLRGGGQIAAPLDNFGTIVADNGVLQFNETLTNNPVGHITVDTAMLRAQKAVTNFGEIAVKNGELQIDQTLASSGTILLDKGSVTGLGTVSNTGLLRGEGTVLTLLENKSGGQILADQGEMNLANLANYATVRDGLGTLKYQKIINQTSGIIRAENGVLDINHNLTNYGTVIQNGGTLNFTGPCTNYGIIRAETNVLDIKSNMKNYGKIIQSGGTLNISEPYINNGTIGAETGILQIQQPFNNKGHLEIKNANLEVNAAIIGNGAISAQQGNIAINTDIET